MRAVFQTTFGYPTGNCFNAAVASILELDEIPSIDPAAPLEEWRRQCFAYFDRLGWKMISKTWEPEHSNWDYFPAGYAIANVEVAPGILHAIVCLDGVPVHDVMPGSPFLRSLTPLGQRMFRNVAWTYFVPLAPGERNGLDPAATETDFTPAPCGYFHTSTQSGAERRGEANRILDMLEEIDLDRTRPNEHKFLDQMFADRKQAISPRQLFWLRDLKDKYLDAPEGQEDLFA